jgi:CDP-glycerol glycerophosphotransferase (TagB/SpsB family)/tetratricopeptide (TPR) repeat protein
MNDDSNMGPAAESANPIVQGGDAVIPASNPPGASALKAGFYYSLPFQLRVLDPIAHEFDRFIITDKFRELDEESPDVIFTADAAQMPELRRICDKHGTVLVGLRHGVANKYIPVEPEYRLADYVCGSEWDERDFHAGGVAPLKGFILTGNPWIDGVFRVPQRALCKENPTILFAPTYNPEVSAAVFMKRDLVPLIRSVYPESKIIIKPHPAILDNDHPYVAQHRALFQELLEGWEQDSLGDDKVVFVRDSKAPISDFYSETDILISDGSSLIFEFMALNRPILLYTSGQKISIWQNIYDPHAVSNSKRGVGTEFRTKEEFVETLRNAFTLHETVQSGFQQRYSEEMFGTWRDGRSYKRAAEEVKKILCGEMTPVSVRLIAFHLPQYHPIPENDRWWGKGFTEWINVAKARPLFEGHYQPHLPADLGFYDLRLAEARAAQADLARQYGIEGFCFWHYWSGGKLLLERPLVDMLRTNEPDFSFCLAWANENWTRRWDGQEREILRQQVYNGDEDDAAHFQWLLPFFKDRRAICVDGKPVFLVYRPADLPNPEKTTILWRKCAQESGLAGLFLIAVKTSFAGQGQNWLERGFDGELLFQPNFTEVFRKAEEAKEKGTAVQTQTGAMVVDYKDVWPSLAALGKEVLTNDTLFTSVVPGWDNTARRSSGSLVLRDSTPADYALWLKTEIRRVQRRQPDRRIVFLNAWNEWAEGNHLEPDQKNGRAFLEATARVLRCGIERELPEDALKKKYEQALAAQKNGSFDEAVDILLKILDEDDTFVSAYNDLGALYYQKNEKDKCLQCFRKAVEVDPENVVSKKNLADILMERGEHFEALELYQDILEVNADDIDALLAVGGIMLESGRDKVARRKFVRVLELQPDHAVAGQILENIDGRQEVPVRQPVDLHDRRRLRPVENKLVEKNLER